MTTGSKNTTNNNLPRHPAAKTDQETIPLQSQNIDIPNTDQMFTSGQLDQLCVLIAEAMGTESRQPAGEITTALLSPVSASSQPRANDGLQQNASMLTLLIFYPQMYPVPTSSSENFTLAINPKDTSTLSFVPSQQKKSRINGLSSRLEAWSLYFHTLLSGFPHLAPDLLAYQDQICKSSCKFKSSAWLMYGTAFRHMAASNLSTSWSTINKQLYNNILKEETLPFCITCHSYGHHTVACPSPSKTTQPFCPSAGGSFANTSSSSTMPDPVKSSVHVSTVNPPPQAFQPQPNARWSIRHDFNSCLCRRSNCQFQHTCNKPECGGNHPLASSVLNQSDSSFTPPLISPPY